MKWIKTIETEKPKDGERVVCLCKYRDRYSVAIFMYSHYFQQWSDGFQYFDLDHVEAWTHMDNVAADYKEQSDV